MENQGQRWSGQDLQVQVVTDEPTRLLVRDERRLRGPMTSCTLQCTVPAHVLLLVVGNLRIDTNGRLLQPIIAGRLPVDTSGRILQRIVNDRALLSIVTNHILQYIAGGHVLLLIIDGLAPPVVGNARALPVTVGDLVPQFTTSLDRRPTEGQVRPLTEIAHVLQEGHPV